MAARARVRDGKIYVQVWSSTFPFSILRICAVDDRFSEIDGHSWRQFMPGYARLMLNRSWYVVVGHVNIFVQAPM